MTVKFLFGTLPATETIHTCFNITVKGAQNSNKYISFAVLFT